MKFDFKVNSKAALFFAAFLFFAVAQAITSIENIKNKTAELLATRKKDKAIQLIINYSKTERSRAYKTEASELLFSVGQSFMTKEAQEDYETSLNFTLTNEKTALKAAEQCLKVDPQNLDCHIQKARLHYREKNQKNFLASIEDIKSQLVKTPYEELFQILAEKQKPEFKNKQILTTLPAQPTDRTLFYITLELERSFAAKNYSRAKEIVGYSEKFYPDWPDINYFKNKLNSESAETSQENNDLLTIYINKCKSISHSTARKYRYDFDLCRRGEKI